MAPDRTPKDMATIAKPGEETKPVRVDLSPAVHKELKKAAADEITMAASARKVIEDYVAEQSKGGRK